MKKAVLNENAFILLSFYDDKYHLSYIQIDEILKRSESIALNLDFLIDKVVIKNWRN